MKAKIANVKPFICHEHKYVRKFAIAYLSNSFPMDSDLMTWVSRGVEKYGLNEFGYGITDLWKFPQTEASINWTIKQLAVNNQDVSLKRWLNRIIAEADIDLVFPMLDQLKSKIGIEQRTLEFIRRRHSFTKLSTDKLWEMLMQFSKESEDEYVNKMDYAYGGQIAEVISEREDAPVSTILEMLLNDEMYHGYDEIYCIVLAGRLRLEQAIPILIDKMAIDGDLICEEAVTALSRIGTEAVLQQVSQRFIGESWHFQNYASGVFENIKHPLTAEYAFNLLPHADDLTIETFLATGLCYCLDEKHLETVYDMIIYEKYDSELIDLRQVFYSAATILGLEYSEFPEWVEDFAEREVMYEAQIAKLNLAKANEKVGRNDPCPCGSGKKYKRCCL